MKGSKVRLIDVLILIGVIGILATIALPAYHSSLNRAKAYEAEITLKIARTILLSYYQQNGHYPIVTNPIPLINVMEVEIDSIELAGEHYKAKDYLYISDLNGSTFKIKAVSSKPGMQSLSREINHTGLLVDKLSF